MRNPYTIAFLQIVHSLAKYGRKLGMAGPIDFVFDETSEKRFVIESWEYIKERARPRERLVLCDTPMYRNDITTLPLQAADLYAWFVRQSMVTSRTLEIHELRFPWKLAREMRLLHATCDAEVITRHLNSVFEASSELRWQVPVNWTCPVSLHL